MKNKKILLLIITIIILIIVALSGIMSWNPNLSTVFINQYGMTVKMYGAGIYKSDSFFKAPILIGTDFIALTVIAPLLVYRLIRFARNDSAVTRIEIISSLGFILYYGANIAFGVTYNRLFLLYVALFGISLYTIMFMARNLEMRKNLETNFSIDFFLIFLGASPLIAWLPDILPTIINGNTLQLIEVYTTEVTYVLDIGLIMPLCFITLHLLHKKDKLGTVLLPVLLDCTMMIALTVISGTVFQIKAGINIPIPALITKIAIFIILGIFAFILKLKVMTEIDSY